MTDSLLVYDGGNRLFRGVARQLARLSGDLQFVPWRAPGTRDFLDAQFGAHLFAFVLVDPEAGEVHAGGETVRRLLRDRGAPPRVAAAAERAYRTLGGPFGRLVHGQAPADVDGSFDLAADARPHVETLRRECSLATCEPAFR